MNKSQLLLLKMVATFLINKNGSTTTLEIKDALRERFPKEKWFQSDISQAMIDLHDNDEFNGLTFEDTGEFRVYHRGNGKPVVQVAQSGSPVNAAALKTWMDDGGTTHAVATKPKKAKVAKPVGTTSTLSRTAIVDLMKESKGRFYTVTFIKKDGSERTINGQTKKDNFHDNLGYINFRESNGNQRRVNPQTIQEISISGNIYKVK